MILITEITRNLKTEFSTKRRDSLPIEWYESTKRIQRLKTDDGLEIAIRLLGTNGRLQDGDILYEDEDAIVVVVIKPCEVLVIPIPDIPTIGFISCEIGNKHLPLFVEDGVLLLPFERPMLHWLESNGFNPQRAERKLKNGLNANVDPSHHKSMRVATQKIKVLIKE